MAMQAGFGLSKILIFVGAGYTGTILLKNGKLSGLLGELQALVNKTSDSDHADTDPLAAQVRWLAQEVRQLASRGQVTVLNGSSGQTDVTSLIIPAATLGALGCGYMWLKGLSFSDLMFVTQRSMATAVTNLREHLQIVSGHLDKITRHLSRRIENLDGKIDEHTKLSKTIMNEVRDVHNSIDGVNSELYSLRNVVASLDNKMQLFEDGQDKTLMCLVYLCKTVDGIATKAPELPQLQEQLKISGRSHGQLPSLDSPGLPVSSFLSKGLKELTEGLTESKSITDDDFELNNQPTRNLISRSLLVEMEQVNT